MTQANNPKIVPCHMKIKDCMNSFLTLSMNVHLSGDPTVYRWCPLCGLVYGRSFTQGTDEYGRRGHLAKIHGTVPPCVIEQWRLLLKSHPLRWYNYVQDLTLEYKHHQQNSTGHENSFNTVITDKFIISCYPDEYDVEFNEKGYIESLELLSVEVELHENEPSILYSPEGNIYNIDIFNGAKVNINKIAHNHQGNTISNFEQTNDLMISDGTVLEQIDNAAYEEQIMARFTAKDFDDNTANVIGQRLAYLSSHDKVMFKKYIQRIRKHQQDNPNMNIALKCFNVYGRIKLESLQMSRRNCDEINNLFDEFVSIMGFEIKYSISLSYGAIVNNMPKLNQLTFSQLMRNMSDSITYSLAVDDTSDKSSAHISICSRIASCSSFIQPMITVAGYTGSANAENIHSFCTNVLKEYNIPLFKCSSITTDGASAMRGHLTGFVTRMKMDIERERLQHNFNNTINPCFLLIVQFIYCNDHKMNLTIKYCMECLSLWPVNVLLHWIQGDTVRKQWKCYWFDPATCRQKQKSIPMHSNTRWSFSPDIVNFVKKHLSEIKKFISSDETLKKSYDTHYESYFKLQNRNQRNSQKGVWETFNNNEFHQRLLVLDVLLQSAKKVVELVQVEKGFIPHIHLIIKHHIKYSFYLVQSIKNIADEVDRIVNREQTSQSQGTNNQNDNINVPSNPKKSIEISVEKDLSEYRDFCIKERITDYNDAVAIVYTHIKSLMMEFLSLTGDYIFKEEEVESFSTYQDFIHAFKLCNQNNYYYQLVCILIAWEKKKDLKTNLSEPIQSEYNRFINDINTTHPQHGNNIIELLLLLGKDKYPYLFNNLVAVLCSFPTSTSVERIFSLLRRTYNINMDDKTLFSKLNAILQSRSNNLEYFAYKPKEKK